MRESLPIALDRLSPRQIIALLRTEVDELRAYNDLLKGSLAAANLPELPKPEAWAMPLQPIQRALIGLLYAAYPRYVHKYDILDQLPCRDSGEGDDRSAKLVTVLLSQIRAAVGQKIHENESGGYYRLKPAIRAKIEAGEPLLPEGPPSEG